MADFAIMNANLVLEVDATEVCTSVSLVDDEIVEGTQTYSIFINGASPFVIFDSENVLVVEIGDNDCKLLPHAHYIYTL